MPDQVETSAVRQAREIWDGAAVDVLAGLTLVKQLKKEDAFRWARRVLQKLDRLPTDFSAVRLKIRQELSLCTYKDPDRPRLEALNDALQALSTADDLATTKDQETLGQAGAIHKRLWEVTGQKEHLEKSYRYYRRGHDDEEGRLEKLGYTSINAAFVLDQLASIEEREGGLRSAALRRDAQAIRRTLIEELPPLFDGVRKQELASHWWYLVTIGEAFFGVDDYVNTDKWLQLAKQVPGTADWEFRSTVFQLAALHQLQHPDSTSPPGPHSEAARVLDAFVGSGTARTSAFVGKLGLALSGGGFRASLFHIGVLARLAELDLLRHVEVLSCVSGGSIAGAHYYLQLRELQETTDLEALDDEAVRDCYVALVDRVARDLLAGVQRNIRVRVFSNPLAMLRTVLSRSYSRTVRLGELLEQELFQRVFTGASPERRLPVFHLKELRINPLHTVGFEPKRHNWRRKAKVPVLVLNATTLNTAHNWQYTASFMGESPHALSPTADGTNRLRRMYYKQAPRPHDKTSLGQAVVASACVPGLFEPIRLDQLYERRERGIAAEPFVVRQVDGGVHDNQGIASLFEQDCSVILVSDASGQIVTSTDAGGGFVLPLSRSNSVLMQRVRQEQFARLEAAYKGGRLKGMMFLHLKRDLDVQPVDWLGCQEPSEQADPYRLAESLTSYRIRKEVQNLLAGIRTDLDSFSDVEAFALMTSGYRMAERFLPEINALPKVPPKQCTWPFLEIEKVMSEMPTTDRRYIRLRHLLETGSSRLFRAFRQSRLMLLGAAAAGFGSVAVMLWLLASSLPRTISLSRGGLLISLIVTASFIGALASPRVREHASRIGLAFLAIAIWIPLMLHSRLIDRSFLEMGKLRRLL